MFGTLSQFMGLKKVNTIGLGQANKVMYLSDIAYNLKKHLKFEKNRSKSGAGQLAFEVFVKSVVQDLYLALLRHLKLTFQY
jgi:hypothetical protein